MLTRKIELQINKWIENNSKALLINGVRQAGKTFIIRECLCEKGCNYVEFNLIKQPEVIDILKGSTSIDDLILKLSLFSDIKLVNHIKNFKASIRNGWCFLICIKEDVNF